MIAQRGWWQKLGELMRAVIGAPSYEQYVTHMSAAHPGSPPLSRDEFVSSRLEARYSKPGARCC